MSKTESNQSMKPTTELLTSAFSQIYDKIFINNELSESNKAHIIAEPICLALESINNFGASNSKETASLISLIKEKFKSNPMEKEVIEFCDEIIELTISSNRFVYTYQTIAGHIENVIENDLES